MKYIEIPFARTIARDTELTAVSSFLDTLRFADIEKQSWPEFPYKPEIRFAMAHSGDCIFIKFIVVEKFVRAECRNNNDPVSNDSCVEFFISLEGAHAYYNFEFNCIGTCKAAFGTKDRKNRDYLPGDVIDQIARQSLIRTGGRYHDGVVRWDLTVSIPLQVFCYNRISSLQGLEARANFYKCGDKLPDPHFIVWNEVKAPEPDFHLPEFFGKLHFL